jgi:hypothetical protein
MSDQQVTHMEMSGFNERIIELKKKYDERWNLKKSKIKKVSETASL